MVSLIGLGILLNSVFLESYYVYKNKNSFIALSEKINNEYTKGKNDVSEYLNVIQNVDNTTAIITDEKFNVKYTSTKENKDENPKHIPKEIEQTILNNENKLLKRFIYYVDEKPDEQKTKLVFIKRMSNGEIIILRKPIKIIRESVLIANEFYIIAGIAALIIGSVFIIIFSKKMTKPIIEMSKVAENISELKFDKLVDISSKDEIGNLGESINKISEKLCISIDELKKDVERRKQLVRNISHELKTPIGIIKGYAEGIKYGVADDKGKLEKYCKVLINECDRMDKLILELLNHSMMEVGMIKLNETKFDIFQFMSQIVERFNSTFEDRTITFDFQCIKNYLICADKDMIEKAVNNFITNAIDYVDEKNYIKLAVEKSENGIIISVFNTGNHISEDEVEKIWDVYYKGDKARTRKYGGHGLGLAIVKLVVQLHGGTVKVENVSDGVKFSFEIPEEKNKI
jgi:signal transduction histidine kinase